MMASLGKTITFRPGSPIGQLYERKIGNKRWYKTEPASGDVQLDRGSEYRLRLATQGVGVESVEDILEETDCDLLTEIVIPVRISSPDLMDQATSGNPWVTEYLRQTEKRYQAFLGTTVEVTVKAVVR